MILYGVGYIYGWIDKHEVGLLEWIIMINC
jgi:hypothetical protein